MKEVAALGADIVYLHYGGDQLTEDPNSDDTVTTLEQLKSMGFDLPIGLVAHDLEGARLASTKGADIVLVGNPYLTGPDCEARLTDLVRVVKQARSTDDIAGVRGR